MAFLSPEESDPAGVRRRENVHLRPQAPPVRVAASRLYECLQQDFALASCGMAG
jgi:hypothetical protein